MTQEYAYSPPPESQSLEKVIESMARRLDSVPPDDPAARLLREQLDEIIKQRDRVAEQEDAERYTTNVAAFVAGSAFVLAGASGVGLGLYRLASPGHSASGAIQLLGASLGLALLGGLVGIVIRWPEIREYRANRAARRT